MFSSSSHSSSNQPAEVFRKDLISAMKLPDSYQLQPDEYMVMTDNWKPEWEKGVQVPVNPHSTRRARVKEIRKDEDTGFKLSKKMIKGYGTDEDKEEGAEGPEKKDAMCQYDLDGVDAQWLFLVNELRQEIGDEAIDELTMERILEECDTQCNKNMEHAMQTEEGLGIEYDEDVICDVCRAPDSEEGNEMVFCDKCDICVHQACYGIVNVPEGSWMCRTCALGIQPPCILCGVKKGAMKSTRSGTKWSHVSCALWVPEVSIGCVERMEPITKISQIPASRWALICVICRERTGACIQCSVKTCKTAYHVTCGFEEGLEMKTFLDEEADVRFRSYCAKHTKLRKEMNGLDLELGTPEKHHVTHGTHSTHHTHGAHGTHGTPKKEMTQEERANERAKRIQMVTEEFYRFTKMKDIASALGMRDNMETVDLVYEYWKLKRKSGHNKPLVTPTKEVGSLGSNEEYNLTARMKMFVHLRQDLERVRNLCYMVQRREKLSRQFSVLSQSIFRKQCEMQGSGVERYTQEDLEWAIKVGKFAIHLPISEPVAKDTSSSQEACSSKEAFSSKETCPSKEKCASNKKVSKESDCDSAKQAKSSEEDDSDSEESESGSSSSSSESDDGSGPSTRQTEENDSAVKQLSETSSSSESDTETAEQSANRTENEIDAEIPVQIQRELDSDSDLEDTLLVVRNLEDETNSVLEQKHSNSNVNTKKDSKVAAQSVIRSKVNATPDHERTQRKSQHEQDLIIPDRTSRRAKETNSGVLTNKEKKSDVESESECPERTLRKTKKEMHTDVAKHPASKAEIRNDSVVTERVLRKTKETNSEDVKKTGLKSEMESESEITERTLRKTKKEVISDIAKQTEREAEIESDSEVAKRVLRKTKKEIHSDVVEQIGKKAAVVKQIGSKLVLENNHIEVSERTLRKAKEEISSDAEQAERRTERGKDLEVADRTLKKTKRETNSDVEQNDKKMDTIRDFEVAERTLRKTKKDTSSDVDQAEKKVDKEKHLEVAERILRKTKKEVNSDAEQAEKKVEKEKDSEVVERTLRRTKKEVNSDAAEQAERKAEVEQNLLERTLRKPKKEINSEVPEETKRQLEHPVKSPIAERTKHTRRDVGLHVAERSDRNVTKENDSVFEKSVRKMRENDITQKTERKFSERSPEVTDQPVRKLRRDSDVAEQIAKKVRKANYPVSELISRRLRRHMDSVVKQSAAKISDKNDAIYDFHDSEEDSKEESMKEFNSFKLIVHRTDVAKKGGESDSVKERKTESRAGAELEKKEEKKDKKGVEEEDNEETEVEEENEEEKQSADKVKSLEDDDEMEMTDLKKLKEAEDDVADEMRHPRNGLKHEIELHCEADGDVRLPSLPPSRESSISRGRCGSTVSGDADESEVADDSDRDSLSDSKTSSFLPSKSDEEDEPGQQELVQLPVIGASRQRESRTRTSPKPVFETVTSVLQEPASHVPALPSSSASVHSETTNRLIIDPELGPSNRPSLKRKISLKAIREAEMQKNGLARKRKRDSHHRKSKHRDRRSDSDRESDQPMYSIVRTPSKDSPTKISIKIHSPTKISPKRLQLDEDTQIRAKVLGVSPARRRSFKDFHIPRKKQLLTKSTNGPVQRQTPEVDPFEFVDELDEPSIHKPETRSRRKLIDDELDSESSCSDRQFENIDKEVSVCIAGRESPFKGGGEENVTPGGLQAKAAISAREERLKKRNLCSSIRNFIESGGVAQKFKVELNSKLDLNIVESC